MKKLSWGLLCVFLLCGCARNLGTVPVAVIPEEKVETSLSDTQVSLSEENAEGNGEFEEAKPPESTTWEGYYYSIMEETEQTVYQEILRNEEVLVKITM